MPLVPITDAPEQARPQAEQPDPVYLMMAGAMMHQEGRFDLAQNTPTASIPNMPAGEAEANTWDQIIPRKGRTDLEILKTAPGGMEAFTFGGDKDRIMLRKTKPTTQKLEDLVS